jgi:hypothetical protein
MTIYDRPDEKVMAEAALAGEVQAFPDILRGWGVTFDQTGGFPPMEWFNALAKRGDQAVRYFMQRGLPEWSGTEDYPQGAYIQYAGNAYVSKRANVNKPPAASPNDWAAWAMTFDQAYALMGNRLQRFTASGSFVVPAGVTTLYVSGCGGGGGGGGAGSNNTGGAASAGGGGGGAGQPALRTPVAVTPGQVLPITVGAAGAGAPGAAQGVATTSAQIGGNGGVSSVGSLLTLAGGGGGGGGTQGAASGAIAGAVGGNGYPNGGYSSDGLNSSGDNGFSGMSGAGGSSPFGGGAACTRGAKSAGGGLPGLSAGGYGAGGGGGGPVYSTGGPGGPGGSGSPGVLLLEW